MQISQLEGRKVALWGWGREGRAAYRAIRLRLPSLPLTLFCLADEVADTNASDDGLLQVETNVTGERLSAFDVVVKSPGISPYRDEVRAAVEQGTRFIGGTTLWFAEHAHAGDSDSRTICVTGTKGKSTTSALLAHLLRAGGHRTALAGNIGLPLLELLDVPQPPQFWVIELSSYQTGDVADSGVRPDIAVVLNVFPEHLDWHGSQARYVADKLRLLTDARPRAAVLNADDATLTMLSAGMPHASARNALDVPQHAAIVAPDNSRIAGDTNVHWFGRADGWHLREDALYRDKTFVMDTALLPLPGRHNRGNLCAALAAIDALGLDAAALAPHALTFVPLPHRLQTLGTRDGITHVNDSISTTPHASLAALEVFRDERVAILLGGHDRGLDWSVFVQALDDHAPAVIVTMGQNGPRIHGLLTPIAAQSGIRLSAAVDLADAVEQATTALLGNGVLLLSPGAPSYGAYRDFTERGRHFAKLTGWDPDTITAIPGLGIS